MSGGALIATPDDELEGWLPEPLLIATASSMRCEYRGAINVAGSLELHSSSLSATRRGPIGVKSGISICPDVSENGV